MNTAKDLVSSLYQNLDNILINSNESHNDLQSKSFSDKLHQFIENDNISISTSPVVLAADFLQTAGKTKLLHQVFNLIFLFKNEIFCFFLRVNN